MIRQRGLDLNPAAATSMFRHRNVTDQFSRKVPKYGNRGFVSASYPVDNTVEEERASFQRVLCGSSQVARLFRIRSILLARRQFRRNSWLAGQGALRLLHCRAPFYALTAKARKGTSSLTFLAPKFPQAPSRLRAFPSVAGGAEIRFGDRLLLCIQQSLCPNRYPETSGAKHVSIEIGMSTRRVAASKHVPGHAIVDAISQRRGLGIPPFLKSRFELGLRRRLHAIKHP